LDGFLSQKTNFPFEIVIHDDCSTDGTREIIEEYSQKFPDIIFPMFQHENQYSKGIRGMMARFNFPRCRGKYIALCEGDDYWTDPYKLQKQLGFKRHEPVWFMVYKLRKAMVNRDSRYTL
jgi:glycosyltransferase involved in cell wall biosynthesis